MRRAGLIMKPGASSKKPKLSTGSEVHETRVHYVNWNKPEIERQIPHVLSHIWSYKSLSELKRVITKERYGERNDKAIKTQIEIVGSGVPEQSPIA